MLQVGSDPNADIHISQATVSRLHCALEWTGTAWSIRDLGSTNGTFVNGQRIDAPCVLKPSDQVTLGRGIPLSLPQPPSEPSVLPRRDSIPKKIVSPREPFPSKDCLAPNPVGLLAWGVPASIFALTAILFASVLFFSSRTVTKPNDANQPKSVDTAAKEKPSSSSENPTTPATPSSPVNETTLSNPAPAKVSSPFYAVTVESDDRKQRKLFGTAIAIDSHRLLTLASIVEAANQVATNYPRMKFIPRGSGLLGYDKQHVEIHPKFSSLADKQNFGDAFNCRIIGFPTFETIPDIETSLDRFYVEKDAQCKREQTPQTTSYFIETTDFPSIPVVSMICLDDKSNVIGICVRPVPNEMINQSQRCEIAIPEVFWKK